MFQNCLGTDTEHDVCRGNQSGRGDGQTLKKGYVPVCMMLVRNASYTVLEAISLLSPSS